MNKLQLPVAKESFPFLAISGALTFLLFLFNPWTGLIPALFFAFCLYFFRNPQRQILIDERSALSPADGVVMDVCRQEGSELLAEDSWKVTIFLSLFNVHFNRVPVQGTVAGVHYVPGKFLPAFKSHASLLNERNYVLFQTARGMVMVAQITGFVARRIVCWAKKGETFAQGERFGLIKFGSCTEVYLPLSYEIAVQQGDKVKGGLSVIGRVN